jgi:ketosteroid isomerase-like protein
LAQGDKLLPLFSHQHHKEADMHRWMTLLLVAGFCASCSSSANVEQERETLMRLDRDWSASVKDMDKFMSFYAPDAAMYAPNLPVSTGPGPFATPLPRCLQRRASHSSSSPRVPTFAASGDLGYTTGTYKASMNGAAEQGKYVEVWKKQSDGQWKVRADIFNSNESAPQRHTSCSAQCHQLD